MLARRGPAVQDLLVFHPVMDPHVRDLRYFLAVARELQVSRAAETLYISQPALSKQIRALERQLRVTLFDREPGGVRLTRAGAELVPRAERIVAEWEAAKQALARASDCALVIGMQTSPGRGLLPAVRARLVGELPGGAARAPPGRLGRPLRGARRPRDRRRLRLAPAPAAAVPLGDGGARAATGRAAAGPPARRPRRGRDGRPARRAVPRPARARGGRARLLARGRRARRPPGARRRRDQRHRGDLRGGVDRDRRLPARRRQRARSSRAATSRWCRCATSRPPSWCSRGTSATARRCSSGSPRCARRSPRCPPRPRAAAHPRRSDRVGPTSPPVTDP